MFSRCGQIVSICSSVDSKSFLFSSCSQGLVLTLLCRTLTLRTQILQILLTGSNFLLTTLFTWDGSVVTDTFQGDEEFSLGRFATYIVCENLLCARTKCVDACLLYPIRLDVPLIYLHGRHRLEAARAYLDVCDRWWMVDLYSTCKKSNILNATLLNILGLSTEAKSALQHDHSNNSNFSDGAIFRYWRRCITNDDEHGKLKWLARFLRASDEM